MAFDLEIGRAIREGFHEAIAESQSVVLGALFFLVVLGILTLALVGAVNWLQDYVSLLETRWIIRRMEQGGLITLLFADFLATATISIGIIVKSLDKFSLLFLG